MKIDKLPKHIKFAGLRALSHKTVFFIEMNGGQIISAHKQVDFAHDLAGPGPVDQIRQQMAANPQAPERLRDRDAELTSMAYALAFAPAKRQGPSQLPIQFCQKVQARR